MPDSSAHEFSLAGTSFLNEQRMTGTSNLSVQDQDDIARMRAARQPNYRALTAEHQSPSTKPAAKSQTFAYNSTTNNLSEERMVRKPVDSQASPVEQARQMFRGQTRMSLPQPGK